MQEFDYELEVEGTIPNELRGTLFRNGPGLTNVFGNDLVHPIDGDGMVCVLAMFLSIYRSIYLTISNTICPLSLSLSLSLSLIWIDLFHPIGKWKGPLSFQIRKNQRVPFGATTTENVIQGNDGKRSSSLADGQAQRMDPRRYPIQSTQSQVGLLFF